MNDYINELFSISRALNTNRVDWGEGRKGKGRRQRRKRLLPGLPRLCHTGEGRKRKARGEMAKQTRGSEGLLQNLLGWVPHRWPLCGQCLLLPLTVSVLPAGWGAGGRRAGWSQAILVCLSTAQSPGS